MLLARSTELLSKFGHFQHDLAMDQFPGQPITVTAVYKTRAEAELAAHRLHGLDNRTTQEIQAAHHAQPAERERFS
eukprot:9628602-Alexandrium_andersonii.AAC.1